MYYATRVRDIIGRGPSRNVCKNDIPHVLLKYRRAKRRIYYRLFIVDFRY